MWRSPAHDPHPATYRTRHVRRVLPEAAAATSCVRHVWRAEPRGRLSSAWPTGLPWMLCARDARGEVQHVRQAGNRRPADGPRLRHLSPMRGLQWSGGLQRVRADRGGCLQDRRGPAAVSHMLAPAPAACALYLLWARDGSAPPGTQWVDLRNVLQQVLSSQGAVLDLLEAQARSCSRRGWTRHMRQLPGAAQGSGPL